MRRYFSPGTSTGAAFSPSSTGQPALLTEAEQKRIRAFVINKFRGDKEILKPGLSMLYERIRIPFAGVIPYMDVDVDDEDSLSERLTEKHGTGPLLDRSGHAAFAKISVIRLPRISNFTDLMHWSDCRGSRFLM